MSEKFNDTEPQPVPDEDTQQSEKGQPVPPQTEVDGPDTAHQIHVQRPYPSLVGQVFEGDRVRDAKIIDQNVRRSSERFEHVCDCAIDSPPRGQIGDEDSAPGVPTLHQSALISIRHDHARALRRKHVRDSRANTVRAGRYKAQLIL